MFSRSLAISLVLALGQDTDLGLLGGSPVGTTDGTIDTDDGSSLVELRLDGTSAIQVDTTLAPNEIAQVLASLVPLDLQHPPAATLPLTSSAI